MILLVLGKSNDFVADEIRLRDANIVNGGCWVRVILLVESDGEGNGD